MPNSMIHEATTPTGRIPRAIRVPFVRPALPPIERLQPDYEAILSSGQLTKGEYVRRLEAAVAEHLGVRHAVAVSSCTVGLVLVYRGLDLVAGRCTAGPSAPSCAVGSMESLSRFGCDGGEGGGRPRGEVILPSFTFLAAPAAIVWNNLRPVFVDVDPATTNVTPAAVEAAITPHTVAISACHNFGNPCDVTGLARVATAHRIPLVIDAAHGFGASQHGRPVGAGATAQVFSLSPTKLLVAGEGGIVATDCDCLASVVRLGREYGNDGSYDAKFAGVNGRMPEMSAATALAGLDILADVAAHRRGLAEGYRRGLMALPGVGFVAETPGAVSCHKDFSITIDPAAFGAERDTVRAALGARGIETRSYYDPPCHRQTAFAQFHASGRVLPVTDMLASRSVSLPIGPQVDDGVVAEVCETIANVGRRS